MFLGEVLEDMPETDPDLDVALNVENVSFTWDAPPPEPEDTKSKKKGKKDKTFASALETLKDGPLFQLRDVSLSIPRGKLVAFVGPVGSGKTSLLQGIIGEMRRVPDEAGNKGNITFGGSVGYCPQSAWIQVGTAAADLAHA